MPALPLICAASSHSCLTFSCLMVIWISSKLHIQNFIDPCVFFSSLGIASHRFWDQPLLYYSFQIFLPFSYIFCHLKSGGFAVIGFIKVFFRGMAFCFVCLLKPPCIGGQTRARTWRSPCVLTCLTLFLTALAQGGHCPVWLPRYRLYPRSGSSIPWGPPQGSAH